MKKLALLPFALVACSPASPSVPARTVVAVPEPKPQEPERDPEPIGVSDAGEAVADDAVGRALLEARKGGRGLLAVFCAEWAGPCRPLESALAAGPVARVVAPRYAVLRVDVSTEEGSALSSKYAIDTIPTVLVLEGTSPPEQIRGYVNDDELLEWFTAHSQR